MIADKREFYSGWGLLASFAAVLALIFMPIFNGHNGLDYMDDLYNSISKGSAYYIPKLKEATPSVADSRIAVRLALPEGTDMIRAGMLFARSGAAPGEKDGGLAVSGSLKRILDNCLTDSDLMYHNDGKALVEKYGYDERGVIYNWYLTLQAMERELKKQKQFAEAKLVAEVVQKAVECSYNYYTIEPKKIGDSLGVVVFSLVFYVVYTLWYGFGFLFLFEGWGLRLEH